MLAPGLVLVQRQTLTTEEELMGVRARQTAWFASLGWDPQEDNSSPGPGFEAKGATPDLGCPSRAELSGEGPRELQLLSCVLTDQNHGYQAEPTWIALSSRRANVHTAIATEASPRMAKAWGA